MSSDIEKLQTEVSPAGSAAGRLMIIGEKHQAAVWEQTVRGAGWNGEVQIESESLMALGAAPKFRPNLVILDRALLSDNVRSTVVALRHIAGKAKVVALIGNDQEREEVIDAGVDHALLKPLDVDATRSLLAAMADAKPAAVDHDPPRENAAPSLEVTADEMARHGVLVPDEGEKPARRVIGDIDLVDQIVRDHQSLPQVAVSLVAQETGLNGVGWSPTLDGVPAGHAKAEIRRGDRAFGFVHAPLPATDDDLESWSQWLGHWMALRHHVNELWTLALRDDLTGAWNRRYFRRFLQSIVDRASHERFRVTLLVFDIDDFKKYNDRYGHAAGDEILVQAARLMQSVVREHDVVARIGGDEFAVIFWDADAPREPNSEHPDNVKFVTERFRRAICAHKFPKLLEEAPGTLTISAGLAGFPWDGRTPDDLLNKADEMALKSKQQGKNAVTFGPGAMQTCAMDDPATKD